MFLVETLAPILLLIALGSALAHLRFLGRGFMDDLNKLVFWVALPALIFVSVAAIEKPAPRVGLLIAITFGATLGVAALAWLTGRLLRLPPPANGSLIQAAFRGNLAYVGIPVLTYAFAALPAAQREEELGLALLVMTPLMALYNVLAVVVLEGSQHHLSLRALPAILRGIATNPLILASLAGLLFPIFSWHLPLIAHRTLETLGAAAVPVSLLCIGGSLAFVSLRGRKAAIVAAAALKVFAKPALALVLCRLAGVTGPDLRIVLVLAACPTAVASFIMASKLGADESLASGAIALSTVLAAASLALALALS